MKVNDVVFPHTTAYDIKYGIRIRDYIAIQTMTGLYANPNAIARGFDEIADIAYKQADAMIERSEK